MRGMTHNAVKSLYGAPLAGNVGKKLQQREQTVETPDWTVDAVRASLGGAIELDPCAHPDAQRHFATHNVVFPESCGLTASWMDRTYFNPPFDDLRSWLQKASQEAQHGYGVIGLFPCRPHRRWFFEHLKGAECVFLHYNVRFKGHKSAFPAPLVMCAWNCPIVYLGDRETHRIKL